MMIMMELETDGGGQRGPRLKETEKHKCIIITIEKKRNKRV